MSHCHLKRCYYKNIDFSIEDYYCISSTVECHIITKQRCHVIILTQIHNDILHILFFNNAECSCIPTWCLCNGLSQQGSDSCTWNQSHFKFVPCHLCLLFPHSNTSATMARQLISPPRLLFHLSTPPTPPSLWQFGQYPW